MLNGVLYGIDANTITIVLLFTIFFAVLNLALNRVLKSQGTAGIIAFCASLLAVYGINRTSFNLNGLFSNWGLGEKFVYSVVPIIILGLLFLSSFTKDPVTGRKKFRLYRPLLLLGAFLIITSFFVYASTMVLLIGIAFFVVGFLLWLRKKRKDAKTAKAWKKAPKLNMRSW